MFAKIMMYVAILLFVYSVYTAGIQLNTTGTIPFLLRVYVIGFWLIAFYIVNLETQCR